MNISFKNRHFKIWKYDVSHSMLLIRSPMGIGIETNIDILFHGVKFLYLPNEFLGLEITSVSQNFDKDIVVFCEKMNMKLDDFFVFRGGVENYFVVSPGIKVEENLLDIFETPF